MMPPPRTARSRCCRSRRAPGPSRRTTCGSSRRASRLRRARSSALRLRVGQDLLGDPLPRDAGARQPVRRRGCSAAASRSLGRDGADPAGLVRVAAPGLLVVGYFSHPSAVELPADKFNHYLKEEGLDASSLRRGQRNESGAAARELFSRCAKSLAARRPAGEAQQDRPARLHAGARRRAQPLRPGRGRRAAGPPDLRGPAARRRARRRPATR